MNAPDEGHKVARIAAARLAREIDPRLPDQVEQALAEGPREPVARPETVSVTLGRLILEWACLGCFVYHSGPNEPKTIPRYPTILVEELIMCFRRTIDLVPKPPDLTDEVRERVFRVVAEEVIKTVFPDAS